jgi:hypothetical protein
MVQTCSKCSRANPADAVYCYFDGFVLGGAGRNGGPLKVSTQLFISPFVFPTGRACRSFDELALACQEEWGAARNLLVQGYLENFFSSLGRADLALAAKEAARFPDPDRALDQILAKLPSGVLAEPALRVDPLEIKLGVLGTGGDRTFELHLENSGMRLLYGTVNSSDAWLTLGQLPGASEKHFQFNHEQVITVRVRRDRMRAGPKPLDGRLLIESNAGSAIVVVRAEVPAVPFPTGTLAGARSPRQAAEKAKANPKAAAVLFENGAVATWYKDNGWTYPVQGPSASGLGAVQQFFEALGLTPPPRVHISERAVTFQANPGDTLFYTLEVSSEAKRPVYAHAVSNQYWLEVGRPRLNGNRATVPLSIPAVPNQPGETLTARLSVQSNGNQRFVVPVTLQVGGVFDFAAMTAPSPPPLPAAPPAARPSRETLPLQPKETLPEAQPPPVGAVSTLIMDAPPLPLPLPSTVVRPRHSAGRVRRVHLIPAGLLLLALLGVVVWDVVQPATTSEVEEQGLGVAFDSGGEQVLGFVYDPKPDPHDIQYRFGLVLLKEKDPKNDGGKKRLTYRENGASNNVCIRVEGHDYFYGKVPGERLGRAELNNKNHAWKTGWQFREEGVQVTQLVQIVPGAQSGQLDTCLVRYTVVNKSSVPRKVGLRVLLDTYIGSNDGVPFTIEGRSGLLTTPEVFENDKVPAFIQALERPDPKDPGTVAMLGLKGIEVPKVDLEPITKVLICPWESDAVGWDVAISEENHNKKIDDSCVVLYWAEREMKAGAVRDMAFTYGLNAISAPEGSGNMALTVGGSFVADNDFTATVYIKNPKDGQTVTLVLPEGLSFAAGQSAQQAVPPVHGQDDYSQVSWRVHSSKPGKFNLRATSGVSGVVHRVKISSGSLFR